jgi:hypothetical protein
MTGGIKSSESFTMNPTGGEGLHDDLIKKLIYLRAKIEVNYLDPLSHALFFVCCSSLPMLCGNLESAQIQLKAQTDDEKLQSCAIQSVGNLQLARLLFF